MTSSVRRPLFNPSDRTWRWWSSPDQPDSMALDRGRATPIEVEWSVSRDGQGGRHWHGLFEAVPGFAPFLWTLADGQLWLRRPEGVWVASLPALKARDYLLLQEGHPTLGRRSPIVALPEVRDDAWHFSGSGEPVLLSTVDRVLLGEGRFDTDGRPVLLVPPDRHRYTYGPRILVPDWSEAGPMTARLGLVVDEQVKTMLLITLPNEVMAAVDLGNGRVFHDLVMRGDVRLEMGDDVWSPCWQQPLTV